MRWHARYIVVEAEKEGAQVFFLPQDRNGETRYNVAINGAFVQGAMDANRSIGGAVSKYPISLYDEDDDP